MTLSTLSLHLSNVSKEVALHLLRTQIFVKQTNLFVQPQSFILLERV